MTQYFFFILLDTSCGMSNTDGMTVAYIRQRHVKHRHDIPSNEPIFPKQLVNHQAKYATWHITINWAVNNVTVNCIVPVNYHGCEAICFEDKLFLFLILLLKSHGDFVQQLDDLRKVLHGDLTTYLHLLV